MFVLIGFIKAFQEFIGAIIGFIQAFQEIIGAMIGVLGVFIITFLTMDHQIKADKKNNDEQIAKLQEQLDLEKQKILIDNLPALEFELYRENMEKIKTMSKPVDLDRAEMPCEKVIIKNLANQLLREIRVYVLDFKVDKNSKELEKLSDYDLGIRICYVGANQEECIDKSEYLYQITTETAFNFAGNIAYVIVCGLSEKGNVIITVGKKINIVEGKISQTKVETGNREITVGIGIGRDYANYFINDESLEDKFFNNIKQAPVYKYQKDVAREYMKSLNH